MHADIFRNDGISGSATTSIKIAASFSNNSVKGDGEVAFVLFLQLLHRSEIISRDQEKKKIPILGF